jgi:hypothetical protein
LKAFSFGAANATRGANKAVAKINFLNIWQILYAIKKTTIERTHKKTIGS